MNADTRIDQWRDRLPFYVAGTLTVSERLAVEDHLRGCVTCRAEVHIWRSIAEAVRAETVARASSSDLPMLPTFVNERKSTMFSDRSTLPRRSSNPAWRSLNQTGWLGLSASLLVIVLIAALALGTLSPMFGNRQGGIGASTQINTAVQSPIPQPLGTLPGDCPPAPLGMTVNADTGVAVGGYPLWVVMAAYRAALPFYGEGPHTPFGWQAKVLWLAQPDYQGVITVHGANLKSGAPLYFDPLPIDTGMKNTTLTIDTTRLSPAALHEQWLTVGSDIYVPEAGCYSLEMDWAGGSWRFIFPAGHVSNAMETATTLNNSSTQTQAAIFSQATLIVVTATAGAKHQAMLDATLLNASGTPYILPSRTLTPFPVFGTQTQAAIFRTATAGAILQGSLIATLQGTNGPIQPTVTATTPVCTTQVALSDLLQETETALPTPPVLLPEQTSAPPATFAPIPFDQLALSCPSPINLTITPIPVPACTTPTDGSTPTPSPTAAAPGAVTIDCLPPGQHVYIQVCPATIPLGNSLAFHGVLGPPFPTCAPTDPPYVSINTRTPTPTASITPVPGTPTPSAQ